MFKKTTEVFFETGLIIFFLGVIFLPLMKMILTPDKSQLSKTEKRKLAPMPSFPRDFSSFIDFPQQFEIYFNDNFGFREKLVHRYLREMKKRFGKIESSRVIDGRDGWLFYTGDDMQQDFLGDVPLSNQKLEGWIADQERKEKWLSERGIRYLLVIAPNKQSIYPEYLPDYLVNVKGTTRFEQLENFFDGKLPSYMLSFHEILHDSKNSARLYDKTDTHWNLFGGYIAYNQIVDRLSQWYPAAEFKVDFTFQEELAVEKGGDLAEMIMMQDSLNEERPILTEYDKCSKDYPFNLHLSDIGPEKKEIPKMRGCSSAHLKALVFHDSFFHRISPFLTENFKQVVYLSKKYDQENVEQLIELFHPDLVIEERVERFLF